MKRPGLRWVMLWPVVLTVSVGALALGVYVERSVQRDLIETTDGELERALNLAIERSGPSLGGREGRPPANTPGGGASSLDSEPRGADEAPVQLVVDLSGEVQYLTQTPDDFDLAIVDELVGATGFQTLDGEPRYRARTQVRPQGETIVVALSLRTADESLASLRRNLILGGFVLVAVQAAVVLLIATTVARPVTQMSDAARLIASGELDSNVGSPRGPKETAMLATALSQMLDRLRHTITVQEQSAARANQARRDMERFMADASHELGTPLTALRGYSDLYQNDMLDQEGLDRAMERIGSESERLSRLVADLLELTRDESVKAEVDVAAVVSAVTHDLRAANPDREISLQLEADASLLVEGSPHRLHQAVLNLAANACQHTAVNTPVEVVARRDDGSVAVSIIDHGAGVDLDPAAELFLPFTRGDASRSRRSHDGAGLGLALVHQIAEQHGGSVAVEATPGGGATFRLTIPLLAGVDGDRSTALGRAPGQSSIQ